jgi:hypothetical protein
MEALVTEWFEDGTWASSFRHTESIRDIVQTISKEEFPTLLRLAASSLSSMKKEATNVQYKESLDREVEEQTQRIQKKAEEQLARVLAEKQEEVTRLRTTVTELEVQKESQRRGEEEYRASLRSLQEGTQANHSKEMQRLTAYTESLQAQILQIQEKAQKTFQGSLQAIEERYSKEVERVRDDMKLRTAELQMLLAKAEDSRKVGSCDIGQRGEQELEDLVAEYTTWGALENTSKQPQCADWSCVVRKCKILFEVKNYASDVPKAEVTKFERDMALHSDAPLGIFLSLKSRLQGKKFNDLITIEWSPASQMLIYVNTLYKQDMRSVFSFLDVCIDVAFRTYRLAASVPSDTESVRLQEKLLKVKALLGHELLRTAEWMKDAKSETKAIADLLAKQGIITQEKINMTRSLLMSVIGVIDGEESCDPASASASAPVVADQPKASPKKPKKSSHPV